MNAIDLSEYEVVYRRPEALTDVFTHYCPGCTHGLIHRLVGEVIDELGIRERTICVAPVGCAVFAYNYFNTDACEAAHGRAAGHGDRPKAHPARQGRFHVSG